VSAPHKATKPPATHAAKKIQAEPDDAATLAGVPNIPMPTTRLTTIMVTEKKPSWFLEAIFPGFVMLCFFFP
jgi:hypothetical protein